MNTQSLEAEHATWSWSCLQGDPWDGNRRALGAQYRNPALGKRGK